MHRTLNLLIAILFMLAALAGCSSDDPASTFESTVFIDLNWPPPDSGELSGDYVSANGRWDDSRHIVRGIDHYDCPDTTVTPLAAIDDTSSVHPCDGSRGKLRGPVTAVNAQGGWVEIMGTQLTAQLLDDPSSIARRLEDVAVGERVSAHIEYTDTGWVVFRLRVWRGQKDQVHGFIEEVLDRLENADRIRVFDTEVVIPDAVPEDDYEPDADADAEARDNSFDGRG